MASRFRALIAAARQRRQFGSHNAPEPVAVAPSVVTRGAVDRSHSNRGPIRLVLMLVLILEFLVSSSHAPASERPLPLFLEECWKDFPGRCILTLVGRYRGTGS